jgi:hypothetical protein
MRKMMGLVCCCVLFGASFGTPGCTVEPESESDPAEEIAEAGEVEAPAKEEQKLCKYANCYNQCRDGGGSAEHCYIYCTSMCGVP